jgi:hypothetical protein
VSAADDAPGAGEQLGWLIASAQRTDLAAVRAEAPDLWRELRRFNAPAQLALAAAHDVAARARVAAEAALLALAPCQAGSPELFRWVTDVERRAATEPRAARMNPTHTLHVVDNLALSVLAIQLGNRAFGLGLGGSAGQLWSALEIVGERIARGDREVIVLAGDQESSERESPACGLALLFAAERARYGALGCPVRLRAVRRRRAPGTAQPHAARGGLALLAALHARGGVGGRFEHAVADADSDGVDAITVVWELEP